MTTPTFHSIPPVRVALVPAMADLYRRHRPELPDQFAAVLLTWGESLALPAFYHCRVIQADGHLAVSSPVWVG